MNHRISIFHLICPKLDKPLPTGKWKMTYCERWSTADAWCMHTRWTSQCVAPTFRRALPIYFGFHHMQFCGSTIDLQSKPSKSDNHYSAAKVKRISHLFISVLRDVGWKIAYALRSECGPSDNGDVWCAQRSKNHSEHIDRIEIKKIIYVKVEYSQRRTAHRIQIGADVFRKIRFFLRTARPANENEIREKYIQTDHLKN